MGMSEVTAYLMKVLLSLSLSGAVLAVGLLCFQALMGAKLSQRWRYYIWLLVVAKLLIPYSIQSSFMGHLFDRADAYITTAQVAGWTDESESAPSAQRSPADRGDAPAQTPVQQGQTEAPAPPADLEDEPTPAPKPTALDLWQMAWALWLGVAALLLARTALGCRRYWNHLRQDSRPVTDPMILGSYRQTCREMEVRRPPRLVHNPGVTSPLLAGLLRPVIVLSPLDGDPQELRYIFLHELTHHKRRDGWYKLLVHLTACIHWFNPLVYKVRREMERACELSCDEAVLRRLDEEGRLRYGDVLMAVVRSGRQGAGVPALMLGEDAKTIKSRLAAILRFRPCTRWALAVAGAATAVLIICAVVLGAYTVPNARAYGNDAVIARESESRNGSVVSSVTEEGDIALHMERMNGVSTFLYLEATEETTLEMRYDVTMQDGDYMIALVKDARDVKMITEGALSGVQYLKLHPGMYKLKSVGKGATVDAVIRLGDIDGAIRILSPHLPQAAAQQLDTPAPAQPVEAQGVGYTERYSANHSASIGVRGVDGTWAAADTAEGANRQELLDSKLAYIEEVYRERGEGFIIDEGIAPEEVTDVSGVRYLYDKSQIYRDLVAVADTLHIAGGSTFSQLGEQDQSPLYERHVFRPVGASTLDLRMDYRLQEGRLGLMVVSPEGEIVYRHEPVAAFADHVLLPVYDGLWSVVLVSELQGGHMSGEKTIVGLLSGEGEEYSGGRPSKEAVYAEYAAYGFSYKDMTYDGQPVAYFDDNQIGSWLAVTGGAAGPDGIYLQVIRDHSVPGPLGFGQIRSINSYTQAEWEAHKEQKQSEEIR